jgi:hypothetical protein
MNFAQAKQNTGNRTEINAKIIKVWPEETTKNNKRIQKIDVTDGQETHKVTNWINANYPSMTPMEFEGKECQWVVSHSVYQNKDQYSGWPTKKPNTHPIASTPAPQQAQDKPDWDKIAEGKVMCNVVCSAIQSKQMKCEDLNDVQMYTNIIMGRQDAGRQIRDIQEVEDRF